MRELYDTEKELIIALIQNISRKSGLRIGDVLLQVYPIEYIEKNKIDDPFYKETIKICHRATEDIEAKLYEAFALIIMLIEQRYIVAKEFIGNDVIGKKDSLCYSLNNRYEERTYYNYYDIDLWKLLNSHYSITNSLIDFAKDFNTPEQRRHKCTTIISVLAIVVSIIIGLFSPCISEQISKKSDEESLIQVITAIKGHKIVTIDSVQLSPTGTIYVKIAQPEVKTEPIHMESSLVAPNQ